MKYVVLPQVDNSYSMKWYASFIDFIEHPEKKMLCPRGALKVMPFKDDGKFDTVKYTLDYRECPLGIRWILRTESGFMIYSADGAFFEMREIPIVPVKVKTVAYTHKVAESLAESGVGIDGRYIENKWWVCCDESKRSSIKATIGRLLNGSIEKMNVRTADRAVAKVFIQYGDKPEYSYSIRICAALIWKDDMIAAVDLLNGMLTLLNPSLYEDHF